VPNSPAPEIAGNHALVVDAEQLVERRIGRVIDRLKGEGLSGTSAASGGRCPFGEVHASDLLGSLRGSGHLVAAGVHLAAMRRSQR
jgi:hypothetical protein